MFCQECGAEIRQVARFCNKCGVEVKQRFGGEAAAPKRETPPRHQAEPPTDERSASAERAWPRVENTLVMPVVSKPIPPEPPVVKPEPSRRPPRDPNGERPTLFEPSTPKPAVSQSAPVSRDETPSSETPRREETPRTSKPPSSNAALRGEFARKPFFTQVAPAVTNRQHSRLMLILLILLPIVIAVALLAYRAAK